MQRYANMLAEGMQQRGHTVETWSPQAKFFTLPASLTIKKWLGYIDQYIVFPHQVKRRMRRSPPGTLFVFADHALGPWVPLANNKPHIIHCHDFLAQRSAANEIPGQVTSFTGKLYQRYIRRGYQSGKNFISVSQKTREDLGQFLTKPPSFSTVVYNGLNQCFQPGNARDARVYLGKALEIDLSKGYLLHIGGNQWYKNREGVIDIYNSWRNNSETVLPLLMIGKPPTKELLQLREQSQFKEDIYFRVTVADEAIRQAYVGATIFLFPSLAEGFGWPIAEAMASGCPVITTGEAPMTEVGGDAAFYIPSRPIEAAHLDSWANDAAKVIKTVVELSPGQRMAIINRGLDNSKRFDTEKAIATIEKIYQKILKGYGEGVQGYTKADCKPARN
jgi:glycosyltransferase involved in cell wall biosynthesis